jgi:hypothetical protein
MRRKVASNGRHFLARRHPLGSSCSDVGWHPVHERSPRPPGNLAAWGKEVWVSWLLLFPLIALGLVAVVSFAFVRFSSLRITNTGVEIRNFPQTPKTIPLVQADRFVEAERAGTFSGLRPRTATLLLTDGSRVPSHAISEPDAGRGVDALNRRLAALRGDR